MSKPFPKINQSLIEQVQDDVITCVDGFVSPDFDPHVQMVDALCQIIVDRLGREKTKIRKPRLCRIHVSQPAIRQNLKEIREGTGPRQSSCNHVQTWQR